MVSQTAGKATKDADGGAADEDHSGRRRRGASRSPSTAAPSTSRRTRRTAWSSIALDEIGSAENTKAATWRSTVTDVSANINKIYTDLATQAKNELGTAVDALTTINQGGNRFDACGAPSCTLVVDITNPSKKAVKVHLKADWTGDNAPLGSCEATVGPVPPGASATMSCAITTPAVGELLPAGQLGARQPPVRRGVDRAGARRPAGRRHAAGARRREARRREERKEGDEGHAVYQITYADGVWKYGVVARPLLARPREGPAARLPRAAPSRSCTSSLVTTAENPVSAYALATQLVATYQGRGRVPGRPVGELHAVSRFDDRSRPARRRLPRPAAGSTPRYGRTYFLATRLLPADRRPSVHALYGFARLADEIVDNAVAPGDPAQALNTLEKALTEAFAGGAGRAPGADWRSPTRSGATTSTSPCSPSSSRPCGWT